MKCDYHSWERGYILLRDSPYMAKTDTDGDFTISNLPYGTHSFRLWHERVGYVKDISIQNQDIEKGRVTIEINKQVTNVGTIKVPDTLFKKQ